jgi:hypothetical protein
MQPERRRISDVEFYNGKPFILHPPGLVEHRTADVIKNIVELA